MKALYMDAGYNPNATHMHLKEADVVVSRFHDGEGEPFTYRLSVIVLKDGPSAQKMQEAGWRFLDGNRRGLDGKEFLKSIHPNDPSVLRRQLNEVIPELEHDESDWGWVNLSPL